MIARGGAGWAALAIGLILMGVSPNPQTVTSSSLPPSPYEILATGHLDTPPIDAATMCIPDGLAGRFVEIARITAAGDFAAASKLLDEQPDEGPKPLLMAFLGARSAQDRSAQSLARSRLIEVAKGDLSLGTRACVLLELSRLELKLARYPEAAAHSARVAQFAGESVSLEVLAAADFYRAEARYLAGWYEEAGVAMRELSRSSVPRLAAAARLRLADIAFDAGRGAEVLQDLETLVKRATAFGASLSRWSLRVSEAAVDAGKLKVAHSWGERSLDESEGVIRGHSDVEFISVVEIRLADIDAISGEGLASRSRLEAIAERFAGTRLGILADIRLIDLNIDSRPADQRLEVLREAVRTDDTNLSRYAMGLLAHELRELGRLDEALAVITRLSYEAPPSWLTPHLERDADAVLKAVATDSAQADGCLEFIKRVGGRYGLLAQRATEPGPLLRVGECYEQLDLPAIAMGVYRSLARSFAGKISEDVALPLARTALAASDYGLVRVTAAGHVRRKKGQISDWLLLLAEAELKDGKSQRAADLVRPLVEKRKPTGARLRSVIAFARAISRLPLAVQDVDRLGEALNGMSTPDSPRDRAQYAEALLLSAELERDRGNQKQALERYQAAHPLLPEGSMRARTGYWLAALDPDLAAASSRFELASLEETGVWKQLSAAEAHLAPLRAMLRSWPTSRIARATPQ